MPLLLSALTAAPGLPGAGGRSYPGDAADAADEWSEAISAYVAAVVPPALPAKLALAQENLRATLAAAWSSPTHDPIAGAGQLEQALHLFALDLCAGMAPAYVALPPPGLVGFAALFVTRPFPTTRAQGITRFANAIDAWFRTGTATLAAPPYTALTWT